MLSFKNRSIAGSTALIATVLSLAAATPLRAETRQVSVAYGDLDISSEAGATEMQARLRHAAQRVCPRDRNDSWAAVAQCRKNALNGAQARLAVKQAASAVVLATR